MSSSNDVLLQLNSLRVYYRTRNGYVKAVDNVDLTMYKGDALGLIGESGSGKSTLAYSILRLLPRNAEIMGGSIIWMGKDILKLSDEELRKIRWKDIAMVFQGAMNALNPVMTIGDQIVEAIMEHEEVSKDEAIERASKLLEMVGIEDERFSNYPHQLSGGMKQRVVIAMALSLNPHLLIADEPVTALDVIVQAQILNIFKRLKKELGLSILFITHDISLITDLVDKIAIMYAGKIVEVGSVETIFYSPHHPYTKALIRAIPRLRSEKHGIEYIPGDPPDLHNPPKGCRFHPRCPYAVDICREEEPIKKVYGRGEYVLCHLA